MLMWWGLEKEKRKREKKRGKQGRARVWRRNGDC